MRVPNFQANFYNNDTKLPAKSSFVSLLTEINRRMDPTRNGAAQIQGAENERQKCERHYGAAEITEQ